MYVIESKSRCNEDSINEHPASDADMDFLLGGLAATSAGVFSNPFDVIKTRQQLQGELQQQIRGAKQPYGSQWQAIKSIVRAEGLTGLQKGSISFRDFSNFMLFLMVFQFFFFCK